jgi:hypothetical protein
MNMMNHVLQNKLTRPEYAEPFGDDDERLLVMIVGIDVADGSAGQLERKFAVPTGQVVS